MGSRRVCIKTVFRQSDKPFRFFDLLFRTVVAERTAVGTARPSMRKGPVFPGDRRECLSSAADLPAGQPHPDPGDRKQACRCSLSGREPGCENGVHGIGRHGLQPLAAATSPATGRDNGSETPLSRLISTREGSHQVLGAIDGGETGRGRDGVRGDPVLRDRPRIQPF